eukprot:2857241-Rhodomonas_salina.1
MAATNRPDLIDPALLRSDVVPAIDGLCVGLRVPLSTVWLYLGRFWMYRAWGVIVAAGVW